VATYYQGRSGFVVIGGVFDSQEAAAGAITKLTEDVRRNNPSVRSFRSVHSELSALAQ
jgi:septal ring-binding cell division protein DamX